MLRRFNDSFAYMPAWLGCLIAGVATFISMTALLAVSADGHPVAVGAICGCSIALISLVARRFKEWRGRGM
jgi:hypothetical protein